MAFIKNIEHEEIVRIADEISANTGQVVSKTLAQNSCVSITLFAFAKGEEIGTHDSAGDAMVTVIEGKGRFVVVFCRFKSSRPDGLLLLCNKKTA